MDLSEQYFKDSEARRYANRYKGKSFNVLEYIYFNYRLKTISSHVRNLDSKSAVDVGCGTGDLLGAVLKKGFKTKLLTGMDYSNAMLLIAKEKLKNTAFIRADAQMLPYKNESFDLAFSIGVVPYLNEPQKAVSELYRILKTGGVCFLSYPYKKTILSFFRTNPLGLWIRKHILKIAFYEVKYEKEDLLSLLKSAGFNIEKEFRLILSEYLLIIRK